MNYCVIFGNPIKHSKSPDIHHQFAKETGIDLEYKLVCTPLNDLKGALDDAIKKGIRGANITVPFKEEIMQYCDSLTIEAQTAQAVNTIRVIDGKIEGHNTDGIGLIEDIQHEKFYSLKGKRVLLLGAGGASRGILKPLLDCDPVLVTISNRTFEKADQLAKEFNQYGEIKAQEWKRINEPYDLVINATSASLQGVFPELHEKVITLETVGYDLMYSDQPTVFMEYLLNCGGRKAYDGLGMLIEQAVLGFEFWFNVKPDRTQIYQLLRP